MKEVYCVPGTECFIYVDCVNKSTHNNKNQALFWITILQIGHLWFGEDKQLYRVYTETTRVLGCIISKVLSLNFYTKLPLS